MEQIQEFNYAHNLYFNFGDRIIRCNFCGEYEKNRTYYHGWTKCSICAERSRTEKYTDSDYKILRGLVDFTKVYEKK